MAFYLNEADRESMFRRVVGFYTKDIIMEDDGYGSPVLDTIKYEKPVNTVGDLKKALSELCDRKYKDADKFVFFRGSEEKPYSPKDMETVNGSAVIILASEPMPPMVSVDEIRMAVASSPDSAALVFQADGKNAKITDIRLEVLRFPDSPDVMHIVKFAIEETDGIETSPIVKSVEADSIPLDTDQFVAQCEKMAQKSGSADFMKKPVVFQIPSVMGRRFDSKLPEGFPEEALPTLGTVCTVDIVQKKGEHAEVDLMSFDRVKEGMKILNEPGEFDVAGTCAKMSKFKGQDLPLFFMYMGKPYEIEEMKADAGYPVTCVLAPWGTLDESAGTGPSDEIRLWAKWCEDPILSWRA